MRWPSATQEPTPSRTEEAQPQESIAPRGLPGPRSPPQRLRGKAAVLAGAPRQRRHMASHLMLHKILLKPNRLAKWFYAFNNK